ncbi:MAG: hypothetical protein ACLP9L_14645 [Thermoguttaceae bacterium]
MSDSQKWEYLVEDIGIADPDGTATAINHLAKNGWELVFVSQTLHYFKRVKGREARKTTLYQREGAHPTGQDVGSSRQR